MHMCRDKQPIQCRTPRMVSRTHASEKQLFETFGKTRDELGQLADQHTRTVQAWLASRSPKAVQFEGNGIRVSSTGLRVPLLNLALGCNFPVDADDTVIDNEIRDVVAFFESRGVPWLWWIGPYSSPAHITPYLKRQGIIAEPSKLPAMIAPMVSEITTSTVNSAIKVWRASTVADLQAASKIRHKAFRFPAGEALYYFEEMKADWLEDTGPAWLYLAGYRVGSPVAIGAVIMGAGLPGIYIMATLPDYARRGFGKVIMTHLLRHIKSGSNENSMIVLTASRYGFPLYTQFGFQHLFDYSIYAMEI